VDFLADAKEGIAAVTIVIEDVIALTFDLCGLIEKSFHDCY
jgi:hypothetical protein